MALSTLQKGERIVVVDAADDSIAGMVWQRGGLWQVRKRDRRVDGFDRTSLERALDALASALASEQGPGLTESPEGYRVALPAEGLSADFIVDAALDVWRLHASGDVYKNNTLFQGGWGRELLYWAGLVWHKGYGTGRWYRWDALATPPWVDEGLQDPTLLDHSPAWTHVTTPGVAVVDFNGVSWTLGAVAGVGYQLCRNGAPYKDGWAKAIKLADDLVTVWHENPNGNGWLRELETGQWSGFLPDPETGAPTTPSGDFLTSGSISQGSAQLVVQALLGMGVGDWVIVATGREAGAGQRGTIGVGGTSPTMARRYTTVAAMQAALGGTYQGAAWVDDGQGYTWQRRLQGGQYVWVRGDAPYAFNSLGAFGAYYSVKAIPRALQAQILGIVDNGNGTWTLTLSRTAAAAVIGATVYFDQAPVLRALAAALGSGGTLNLPAGDYPVGSPWKIPNKTNVSIVGAGQSVCRVFSPPGCPSASIDWWMSPGLDISGITLQGNIRDEGFGLNWGTADGTSGAHVDSERGLAPVSDTNFLGYVASKGFYANQGSHNSTMTDCTSIDSGLAAFAVAYANNVTGLRLHGRRSAPVRQYLQWDFYWTETDGGGLTDCDWESDYVGSAFERFRAARVRFLRCRSRNGMFSINACVECIDEDCEAVIDGLFVDVDYTSRFNAAFNYSTNALSPYAGDGIAHTNTGLRCKVRVLGPINADGDSMIGLRNYGQYQDGPRNTVIDGFDYSSIPYAAGMKVAPQAVNTNGHGAIIRNSRATAVWRWKPGVSPGGEAQYAAIYGFNANIAGCVNNLVDAGQQVLY
jgi:hypothetical protein